MLTPVAKREREEVGEWLDWGSGDEECSENKENMVPGVHLTPYRADMLTPQRQNYENMLSHSYNTNASTNQSLRTPLRELTLSKGTASKPRSHKAIHIDNHVVNHFCNFR